MDKQLAFYESSFDRIKAVNEGIIVPNEGVNLGYDAAQEKVSVMIKEFDDYLIQQRQRLSCKVSGGNCSNRNHIVFINFCARV